LNSTLKTILLWIGLFVVVILLWKTFQEGRVTRHEVDFSEFLQSVSDGRVKEVTVQGNKLQGAFRQGGPYTEGEAFTTQLLDYPDLVKELRGAQGRHAADHPGELGPADRHRRPVAGVHAPDAGRRQSRPVLR
jgi:ATP-dependent Zn protease